MNMKKTLVAVAVGVAAGVVGYKLYKDHEEEVKEFLNENVVSKIDAYKEKKKSSADQKKLEGEYYYIIPAPVDKP